MNRTHHMNNERPLILISNDDGFQANGLKTLVEMVADMGDVLVCAPDSARSGYACAFSATTPLRLQRRSKDGNVEVWSSNGTPVDCVKLALSQLCQERRPDIVIGGINHGDNASVNTHYSGTMGVTIEGCMKYIPSVAFSICDYSENPDFTPLRPVIRQVVRKVLDEGLPKGVCLNINFPIVPFKGIRVCRMAYGTWYDECEKKHHTRGYDYYWMVGSYRNDEPQEEDTDNWALRHGYVAITPTRIDVTAYEAMDRLNSWGLQIAEE